MKKYSITIIMLLLLLNNVSAKLRNGYEKDIHHVRESLVNYNDILNADDNLSPADKRKIKVRINSLIILESYYELTEELLRQFKSISPNLYNRIDTIRDAKGRDTDVYVKFIPREEATVMAAGITRMAQAYDDVDACFSEYGKYSVSVKVWISCKSLLVLSHELGHVNYQVPNLNTYTEYYKGAYPPVSTEANRIGHLPTDESGKTALTAEKEFKKDFLNHLKFTKGEIRIDSPLVLMEEIKRKVIASQSIAAM